MPHRDVIALYERHAADWDRERGRDLFERPWLDRFAASLAPGARVLDLGCGMGEPIAAYLVQRGFVPTGVDAAPSLVALCRERFPEHAWLVGDMRTWDVPHRYDGLVAWHSLFHLTPADQRPMFARFAALAARGAPLLFTSGPAHGAAIGRWHGQPLYHGSLAPDEYRALLDAHGFDLVDHALDDEATGHATVWLARRREAP